MKKLIVGAAIAMVAAAAIQSCNQEVKMEQSALDNILTRHSVRAYTDDPVSASDVETMLRAAMSAPTAVDARPWRFVVIDDKQQLQTIAATARPWTPVALSQVSIVVCGDLQYPTGKENAVDYWVQDCSAATENLLLAAHALDLGAVWCGIYPIDERVSDMKQLLNLPDSIMPLGIVAIGHPSPDNPGEVKDKWLPSNVSLGTWGNPYFK